MLLMLICNEFLLWMQHISILNKLYSIRNHSAAPMALSLTLSKSHSGYSELNDTAIAKKNQPKRHKFSAE